MKARCDPLVNDLYTAANKGENPWVKTGKPKLKKATVKAPVAKSKAGRRTKRGAYGAAAIGAAGVGGVAAFKGGRRAVSGLKRMANASNAKRYAGQAPNARGESYLKFKSWDQKKQGELDLVHAAGYGAGSGAAFGGSAYLNRKRKRIRKGMTTDAFGVSRVFGLRS